MIGSLLSVGDGEKESAGRSRGFIQAGSMVAGGGFLALAPAKPTRCTVPGKATRLKRPTRPPERQDGHGPSPMDAVDHDAQAAFAMGKEWMPCKDMEAYDQAVRKRS